MSDSHPNPPQDSPDQASTPRYEPAPQQATWQTNQESPQGQLDPNPPAGQNSTTWKWLIGCCLALILLTLLGSCSAIVAGGYLFEQVQRHEQSPYPTETPEPSSSTEEVTTAPASDGGSDEVSTGVKDDKSAALASAQNYVDVMPFSKEKLKEQLTSDYDQFTDEAAQYAVDHVKTDWNANALKAAESYSENLHMSKSGIEQQLVSDADRYTKGEADYAMANLEADFNRNALESAKVYRDELNMSEDAVKHQLINGDHFTEGEAQYAMDNLDK